MDKWVYWDDNGYMNEMVVDALPKELLETLRERAAARGRSMGEELAAALQTMPGVTPAQPRKTREELEEILRGVEKRLLAGNGGTMPKGVVDAFIAERRIETLKEEIKHFEWIAEKADPK